jgi:hypothetical protein
MRDEFTEDVRRKLAQRVGHRCSNPDCRSATAGPQDDPLGTINLGVAAHITAASSGGPRHNPDLTPDQRCSFDNGIWLCQNCAKLIDSDLMHYKEDLLRAWRLVAEDRARSSLGKTATASERLHEVASPTLELFLEDHGASLGYYKEPVRWMVLGLRNAEGRTAKFPWIRFRRVPELSVDHNGIDGNGGFGLPLSPSEQEWITFRGGADDVIHPGQTVKITRLHQQGENKGIEGVDMTPRGGLWGPNGPRIARWVYKPIEFEFEISAEGISIVSGVKSVPECSVEWHT